MSIFDREYVFYVEADKVPNVKVRTISCEDSEEEARDKKKFPFELQGDSTFTVKTSRRTFCFTIEKGYRWNGADIPRFLWWLGSSRDNDYVIASMCHDFLLEHKVEVYTEVFNKAITKRELRRMTSLIFRQVLIEHKMWIAKAYIEAWFVDVFQAIIVGKTWDVIDDV